MSKFINLKIAFSKLTKESNIGEHLIGWFTNSKYYHAEIIIDNTWVSSNPIEGVTIKENFIPEDSSKYDYYNFKTIEILENDYNTIMKFIEKQDDKKYDFLGIILSQVIPISIDNRNKYFCSEIVTKVLQLFLVDEVMDLIPNNTSPGDLAKIFNMEI